VVTPQQILLGPWVTLVQVLVVGQERAGALQGKAAGAPGTVAGATVPSSNSSSSQRVGTIAAGGTGVVMVRGNGLAGQGPANRRRSSSSGRATGRPGRLLVLMVATLGRGRWGLQQQQQLVGVAAVVVVGVVVVRMVS